MIKMKFKYKAKRNLITIIGIIGIIFVVVLSIFMDVSLRRLLGFLVIMFIFYFIDRGFNFEFKKIQHCVIKPLIDL